MKIAVGGSEFFQRYIREIREARLFEPVEIIGLLIDFENINCSGIAKHLEKINAQVVVLGPSHYQQLKPYLNIPCYVIRPSIVDFLSINRQIKDHAKTCTLLPYPDDIDLSAMECGLNIKVNKAWYNATTDIESSVKLLKERGIHTVIGNNKVCSTANHCGVQGIYYYRKDGMIEAIKNAIQMAENSQREKQYINEIKSILSGAMNGVISTSNDGTMSYANKSALRILKTSEDKLYGRSINELLPRDIVERVFADGRQESNIALWFNNVNIMGNLIPLKIGDVIRGVCLNFEDTSKILEFETIIRQEIKRKSFTTRYSFEDIIGASSAIRETVDRAKRFAQNDSTILITAETGAGKEVFAQSIHNLSRRRLYPFVAINCGSIPDTLIESELFGYETGSFTGATSKGKQGLIERAHRGTIFLDDIDSISLSFQSKILRVLQEREIIKIGGDKTIPIDIRFIVATNHNLKAMVEDGLFRNDLYYRLNVLRLSIPPLNQRREDVPELCRFYLCRFDQALFKDIEKSFHNIFEPAFEYHYPGNIRELINITERFVTLADRSRLDDFPYLQQLLVECLDNPKSSVAREQISVTIGEDYAKDVKAAEREVLQYYLAKRGGNMVELAKSLGIGRTTLYSKLKDLSSQ
ncbi:MAG: sigma-54 interaction domain-containing protein [Negativicutes bacterium]